VHDQQNIYFYAETVDPVTPASGDNRMRLYLRTNKTADVGWHGYDYRIVKGNTLQQYAKEAWKDMKTVEFQVTGNKMMITVPRSETGLQESIDIEYKWTDNMQQEDPLDWYVNGDCAPGARFNCMYRHIVREYDMLKRGAKPDGKTSNTTIFQRVIDGVYLAGGGKLIVPEGVYLLGGITLKPNVHLYLEKGAVLLGETNPRPRIRCSNVHNTSITGEGIIEGFKPTDCTNGIITVNQTGQNKYSNSPLIN
jgi:hypothetical protein